MKILYKKWLKPLKPMDLAAISYSLLLGLIILLFHKGLRLWGVWVVAHILFAFLMIVFIRSSENIHFKVLGFIRDWYPVLLFIFFSKR